MDVLQVGGATKEQKKTKTWALRGNSPYRIGVADRDAVQNASAVKHTRRRQTNHTNSMRAALGALSTGHFCGVGLSPDNHMRCRSPTPFGS